jgi:hypothetical protein
MTLGEILARLNDAQAVVTLLDEEPSPDIAAALAREAKRTGRDAHALALEAVRAFTERADDAAWTTLIGRIQKAKSPAAACLLEMISWSLDP